MKHLYLARLTVLLHLCEGILIKVHVTIVFLNELCGAWFLRTNWQIWVNDRVWVWHQWVCDGQVRYVHRHVVALLHLFLVYQTGGLCQVPSIPHALNPHCCNVFILSLPLHCFHSLLGCLIALECFFSTLGILHAHASLSTVQLAEQGLKLVLQFLASVGGVGVVAKCLTAIIHLVLEVSIAATEVLVHVLQVLEPIFVG
mmetsp:Transcript_38500/g.88877  ORF Transcript_38500/g.88877 Transcript_38500/m.88877 type:complete len:200 (-) Transcript_38500:580-1179(-)